MKYYFQELKVWIIKIIFKLFFHKDRNFDYYYLGMKLGLVEPERFGNELENLAILENQLINPEQQDLSIL